MTIVRELLEFSASRPAWQQDLIRRICTQQTLQSSDIEQVLDNLKASHGLAEAQEAAPLREEHLSRRATAPISGRVGSNLQRSQCKPTRSRPTSPVRAGGYHPNLRA